jgi:hypothetical protein
MVTVIRLILTATGLLGPVTVDDWWRSGFEHLGMNFGMTSVNAAHVSAPGNPQFRNCATE